MKSLYDYLLMEVKAADFGKGWQDVSLRGALSAEAKGILQFSSYKTAVAAAANQDSWKEIKIGLDRGESELDSSSLVKFVQTFFKGKSELSEYIVFDEKKGDTADEDKVQLSLRSEWRFVGGKKKLASSIKVLRFWIESTITVYGLGDELPKYGYAINKNGEKLMVYKK